MCNDDNQSSAAMAEAAEQAKAEMKVMQQQMLQMRQKMLAMQQIIEQSQILVSTGLQISTFDYFYLCFEPNSNN